MSKKMLISGDTDENRVAIVEDGRLQNLEIETDDHEQLKGNLYKAIVQKVEPSLQAAFVDFGSEKQGFLPFAEVHPRLYPKDLPAGKRPSIQDVLKPKQEVLVQVVRDEIGNKGATLTTYLAMPGRYLVLMPESEKTGISRKLPDEERQRIKAVLRTLVMPEGFGVIVRTAGLDCSEEDLTRDLSYLTRLWGTIEQRYQNTKGAGLLFEDRSLAIRAIRDYLSEDFTEVWLDNLRSYQEVLDFVSVLMPGHKDLVRLYRDPVPLFIRHGIEDQIEEVFSRRVVLPSGGSIVIDSTEALVAIDVNSGRIKGEDIEETAFLSNMEAAKEIARQVIIRDLGGLVIVDFIDMRDRRKMREVETTLREAFKHDKARRKFSRISEFGLLEMSRQRLKSTLRKSSFDRCKHCDGTGQTRTADSAGMYLLRRIREVAAKGRVQQVVVKAPIPVANFVVNRKRRDLYALEVQHETVVEVYGDPEMRPTQAVLEYYERRGRSHVKASTQTIDLVRAEVVRQHHDDNGKPSKVVLREIPQEIDYDKVYREIEEKHGKIEDKPPAPKVTPSPTTATVGPPRAASGPRSAAPAQGGHLTPPPPSSSPSSMSHAGSSEPRPKMTWWQRLFGVRREDGPISPVTGSTSVPTSSASPLASGPSSASASSSSRSGSASSERSGSGPVSDSRSRRSGSSSAGGRSGSSRSDGRSEGRSDGRGDGRGDGHSDGRSDRRSSGGARRDSANEGGSGRRPRSSEGSAESGDSRSSSSSRRRRRRRSSGGEGSGGEAAASSAAATPTASAGADSKPADSGSSSESEDGRGRRRRSGRSRSRGRGRRGSGDGGNQDGGNQDGGSQHGDSQHGDSQERASSPGARAEGSPGAAAAGGQDSAASERSTSEAASSRGRSTRGRSTGRASAQGDAGGDTGGDTGGETGGRGQSAPAPAAKSDTGAAPAPSAKPDGPPPPPRVSAATKPSEAKPAEAKAAASKPAEAKAAVSKPSEAKSAPKEPAKSTPAPKQAGPGQFVVDLRGGNKSDG